MNEHELYPKSIVHNTNYEIVDSCCLWALHLSSTFSYILLHLLMCSGPLSLFNCEFDSRSFCVLRINYRAISLRSFFLQFHLAAIPFGCYDEHNKKANAHTQTRTMFFSLDRIFVSPKQRCIRVPFQRNRKKKQQIYVLCWCAARLAGSENRSDLNYEQQQKNALCRLEIRAACCFFRTECSAPNGGHKFHNQIW